MGGKEIKTKEIKEPKREVILGKEKEGYEGKYGHAVSSKNLENLLHRWACGLKSALGY